jgi:hypothetical protein
VREPHDKEVCCDLHHTDSIVVILILITTTITTITTALSCTHLVTSSVLPRRAVACFEVEGIHIEHGRGGQAAGPLWY